MVLSTHNDLQHLKSGRQKLEVSCHSGTVQSVSNYPRPHRRRLHLQQNNYSISIHTMMPWLMPKRSWKIRLYCCIMNLVATVWSITSRKYVSCHIFKRIARSWDYLEHVLAQWINDSMPLTNPGLLGTCSSTGTTALLEGKNHYKAHELLKTISAKWKPWLLMNGRLLQHPSWKSWRMLRIMCLFEIVWSASSMTPVQPGQ